MRFAPGYRRFALPAFVGAVVTVVVLLSLGAALLAIDAFALQFSRDPERSPPNEPGVVALADGRASAIRVEDGRAHVGVFMNITDVYVDHASISDSVQTITHHPGARKPVFSRDFDRSERVNIELGAGVGDHEVSLIVGAFVRRIHSYVVPGDELVRGQKLSHIDSGSQADMLLPPEFGSEGVIIEKGESVWVNETVSARRE